MKPNTGLSSGLSMPLKQRDNSITTMGSEVSTMERFSYTQKLIRDFEEENSGN